MSELYKWERISYPNKQDLLIAGLLYAGSGAQTLVIVCHGFTGSKEGGSRALAMAEEFARHGYAVLLFDFSGSGESEGDFADITLTGHIEDLTCSVEYGLAAGFQRIVTLGRSFGGTTALLHGALDRRVAGVCTWAAPAELNKLFNAARGTSNKTQDGLQPLQDLSGTVMVRSTFFSDLAQYNPASSAAQISPRPLLVIHGQNDTVVPVADASLIASAAGAPKELHLIPQADHQFSWHYQEAWQITLTWLLKYFSA